MNLVFMGTSPFAVPALERLLESPHRIMTVVTQPDRPRGRGLEVQPSPVKEAALKRNLHLLQPEDVNAYESMRELRALSPDTIVVAAYGQKLGNELLTLARRYCVNIHPSFLPKYRGPAPVARAILNGETVTGVCIIKLVEKMDAGPILGVSRVEIPPTATTPEMEAKLAEVGADLLVEVLDDIQKDTVVELPQDERDATYARKFEKGDGRIDWRKPGFKIHSFVRALQPFPGAFAFLGGTRLTLYEVQPVRGKSSQRPGIVTTVEKDLFKVACGDGEVAVLELQPEAKRRMTATEFLNGHKLSVGDTLG
ncbi:MAG: methionyl-tRNA formyltransferase [Planctomycetes bacterium]|nr:methionyl-tRNA formyltransferase [Planctomycetota bacterium]